MHVHGFFLIQVTEFATQLHAAREQNINLLEDVSNKIATIKRLESESSKLQHQLVRSLRVSVLQFY